MSAFDHKCGVIIIKPRGISCKEITPIDVLAATPDGTIIDGEGILPADFAAHRVIYEEYPSVNSIVSANPVYATSFAQSGKPIKPYGTTHAEYFGDMIPCTRKLTPSEIESDYNANIGKLIIETINEDPDLLSDVGAALAASDQVYCFGGTPEEAVERLDALERIAQMAFYTELLMRMGPSGGTRMQEDLLRREFEQK